MPFCNKCGQQLADGDKFCVKCGAPCNSKDLSNNSTRKNLYEGEIHKCPNCGEILSSFVSNCPACGYEIRNTKVVSSVKELAIKLEQLEAQRPPQKEKSIFIRTFGSQQLSNTDEKKIDLIKNFAIPNTKEDVIEFIFLASTNIDLKVYGLSSSKYQAINPARRELSDAWVSKLEQALQKAEILFGQTQEYISIRNLYENKVKAIKKAKLQIVWLIGGIIGFYLLFILIMVISTL